MKLLSVLSLLLALAACKKETEEDKLPKATQTGANTAGFLLDGKVWLPKRGATSSGTGPAISALWQRQRYTSKYKLLFGFSRNTDNNDMTSLSFALPDVRQAGTYQLDQAASINTPAFNPPYAVYLRHQPSPDRYYLTGPAATGTLTLTRFDTVARVVSGTFDLTVLEDGGTETHQITHGRFDTTF